ncbi:hypothetical protein ACSBR2_006552 [Camellia fascicularis]
MVFQASPTVAAHHTNHPRNVFDVLMNIAYYISSAIIFLLIVGGIVFFIHCFVLCIQLALRKLVVFLQRVGVLQALEERNKKMVLKTLPPLVKFRAHESVFYCSTLVHSNLLQSKPHVSSGFRDIDLTDQ